MTKEENISIKESAKVLANMYRDMSVDEATDIILTTICAYDPMFRREISE